MTQTYRGKGLRKRERASVEAKKQSDSKGKTHLIDLRIRGVNGRCHREVFLAILFRCVVVAGEHDDQ